MLDTPDAGSPLSPGPIANPRNWEVWCTLKQTATPMLQIRPRRKEKKGSVSSILKLKMGLKKMVPRKAVNLDVADKNKRPWLGGASVERTPGSRLSSTMLVVSFGSTQRLSDFLGLTLPAHLVQKGGDIHQAWYYCHRGMRCGWGACVHEVLCVIVTMSELCERDVDNGILCLE